MNRLTLAIVVVTISMPVAATSLYEVSVDDLYKESAIVVSGTIEVGAKLPKDCGVSYSVRVDRSYKGDTAKGRLFRFRGFGPMQVGARYFLFMSKSGNEFRAIASTNGFDMKLRTEYLERCKHLWPPYTVNLTGAGALKVTGTYSDAVKKAVLFDNFLIRSPIGVDVTELSKGDRYDNDHVDAAMAVEDFTHYMNKLTGTK
ncbi:MAG: hypothetical protein WAV67_11590 [Dokdonella sp.]